VETVGGMWRIAIIRALKGIPHAPHLLICQCYAVSAAHSSMIITEMDIGRLRAADVLPCRTSFFLLNHTSHAICLDHGEIMYSPFPARCPHVGGTLQAPLCPPPRPVPRRYEPH